MAEVYAVELQQLKAHLGADPSSRNKFWNCYVQEMLYGDDTCRGKPEAMTERQDDDL